MIDVDQILKDIIGSDTPIEDETDLIESGLLDSYAFIELFSILEDNSITINPTRIDRDDLRTKKGIEKLIENYNKDNNS